MKRKTRNGNCRLNLLLKHITYITSVLLLVFLFGGNVNPLYGQQLHSQESKRSVVKTANSDRFFQEIDSRTHSVHEIHLTAGYSFNSTPGFWGKIPGAEMRLWTLRYNRKFLLVNGKHILEYVGELNFSVDYTLTASAPPYEPGSFSGFGIAPIGFQFNYNGENTVQPFVKTSAGFMHFKKQFPDERGTNLNFTLELGGGIEFVVGENISLSLGYKYHHMSNGQFGAVNPGVDSNIFYSGITIF